MTEISVLFKFGATDCDLSSVLIKNSRSRLSLHKICRRISLPDSPQIVGVRREEWHLEAITLFKCVAPGRRAKCIMLITKFALEIIFLSILLEIIHVSNVLNDIVPFYSQSRQIVSCFTPKIDIKTEILQRMHLTTKSNLITLLVSNR